MGGSGEHSCTEQDAGTLRGGPVVPGPALTSIPFRHRDVEVVAEGRRLHDAVGDLVVWRGVLIRCLGVSRGNTWAWELCQGES